MHNKKPIKLKNSENVEGFKLQAKSKGPFYIKKITISLYIFVINVYSANIVKEIFSLKTKLLKTDNNINNFIFYTISYYTTIDDDRSTWAYVLFQKQQCTDQICVNRET